MNIREIKRDYSLTDAELALFASNLVSTMTRDASEFAARGVDAADISALEAKEDAFEAFPTDPEYKALVTIATEDKDATRSILLIETRGVSDRAMLKWGEKSGRYKRFDVKGLSGLNDKDLLFAARRVVRVGEEYLLELTAEGLTQIILDDLSARAQTFEDNLNSLRDSIAVRDEKTEERITFGNELYALVSKYCEMGKIIWKDTSEAKYNDYIIYPATHAGMGKVKNLVYDINLRTASWDALPLADDYQLEFKSHTTGALWNLAWEGTETSCDHDPGIGSWYYRCRGHNDSGYGDWSDEIDVIIPS